MSKYALVTGFITAGLGVLVAQNLMQSTTAQALTVLVGVVVNAIVTHTAANALPPVK